MRIGYPSATGMFVVVFALFSLTVGDLKGETNENLFRKYMKLRVGMSHSENEKILGPDWLGSYVGGATTAKLCEAFWIQGRFKIVVCYLSDGRSLGKKFQMKVFEKWIVLSHIYR